MMKAVGARDGQVAQLRDVRSLAELQRLEGLRDDEVRVGVALDVVPGPRGELALPGEVAGAVVRVPPEVVAEGGVPFEAVREAS